MPVTSVFYTKGHDHEIWWEFVDHSPNGFTTHYSSGIVKTGSFIGNEALLARTYALVSAVGIRPAESVPVASCL